MIAIFDAPRLIPTSETIVSGPLFAINGWRSIVDRSLIFYYSLPKNKSVRPPNTLPYLESVSQERSSTLRSILVKISFQNPMILAAIQVFNEVALHMSTSALCVVGCAASSSADDSSNHLLANEPARIYSSIMLHFLWQCDITVAAVETNLWRVPKTE